LEGPVTSLAPSVPEPLLEIFGPLLPPIPILSYFSSCPYFMTSFNQSNEDPTGNFIERLLVKERYDLMF
jgi:hypothetical protein